MKMANEAKNEKHRCCACPDASRSDSIDAWEALMVPEGDALEELACGRPASFPMIDARTSRPLFWLCPNHKEEYRYALDQVVGEELEP